MILADNAIITVCSEDTPILNYFINTHVRFFSTKKKTRFIYQILLNSMKTYQNVLRAVDDRRLAIEARIGDVMETGGLEEMKKRNVRKAGLLYDYLDSSSFYKCAAAAEDRSMMNVTFRTGNEELDAKFVKESVANGFSNLKGHRLVGGMRASIYNAMISLI